MKAYLVLLPLLLAACSITPPPVPFTEDAAEGWSQGMIDAKPNALWGAAGAGCGVFGVGAAYSWDYQPPAGNLVGKSAEFTAMYTESYKQRMRNESTKKAAIGWGIWLAFFVATVTAGGG